MSEMSDEAKLGNGLSNHDCVICNTPIFDNEMIFHIKENGNGTHEYGHLQCAIGGAYTENIESED